MNNFESAQNPPAHKGGDVLTLKTLNTFAVDVITLPDEDELFWYVATKCGRAAPVFGLRDL